MNNYDELKERVNGMLRGFPEFCGIELLEVNDEVTRAYVDLSEKHVNAQNIVHGGVITTLLDEVAGMSVFYHTGGKPLVTRSADVHFLSPATGGRLIASGYIVRLGRHTALVNAEARDSKGTLIATGTFDMYLL